MAKDVVSFIMIPVVVMAIMLGLMVCLGLNVGTIIFPSFLLLVLAFGCAMPAIAGATGRHVWTFLNTLEQTVRLNLPLPRMLRAMAMSGEAGADRMRLAAESLERGEPLTVALDVVPWMPPRIMRLLAAAEHTGRLPEVLGRVVQQQRASLARRTHAQLFHRVYPIVLVIAYLAIGGLFMIFVMPKFEQIFMDFGISLPPTTLALLRAARWSGILMALVVLLLIGSLVWTIAAAARWKVLSGMVEGLGGWIANRLPWIGTIRGHQALGDVLDFAADGIDAGRPADLALAEAAQITTNSALRSRIMHWIDAITDGHSLAEAARLAHMPRLVGGMLATATQTPDVPAVLRFLGRYYASRFSRALALLEAAILPILAVVMGVFVLWFMASIILPMTLLLDASSPYLVGL